MDFHNLVAAAEAILFASGDPIGIDKLGEALELDTSDTLKVLLGLSDRLDRTGSALEVVTLEDAVQLCTRRSYEDYVRRALEIRRNTPLSPAAMEVLAIVAYNQPVTRGFVEQVRGIDSSSVVASLVEKGLLEERGRLELPGRPIAYGTTANFLRCFGLSSLDELPPIPEREGTAGEPVTLDAVIDAGDGETAPAAEEPEGGAVSADD